MATILFDDGAGLVKAGMIDDRGHLTTKTFLSLVAEAPRQLDRTFFSRQDIMFIQPYEDLGGYLVGTSARTQTQEATYETSNFRYTSPDATIRFYAALGSLLPEHQSTMEIRLITGANVEAHRTMEEPIREFFKGTHRFTFNNIAYDITVNEVIVMSQPRGALAYILETPPTILRERMRRRPFNRSTVVIIDIGNFTTDCIVMIPSQQADGMVELEEVYERSFALKFGVQNLRNEIAAIIREMQHMPMDPPLWAIDDTLASGQATNAEGDVVDIASRIAQVRDRLWQRVYTRQIKPRFEGISAHYLFVLGGGATDITYGPAVRATWSHLPGFAIPDHPEECVMRGYAEIAKQYRWSDV